MSSTLSFLDQFNAPSTEGGKRISIYIPKHTHVGDSTLLTLLLSNPTDVFNKLKTHNPEATNATDRAALEAYLSARHEYDEAVKAADEAIDHHKRLLHQQDDCVLTELIRLDNLKVAHRFQPLLPHSIRARHNKFILRTIPNTYLPLPTPLPTSAFRQPPIPSPFLQATPRSTTIPADWQPNPGWTLKGSCRRCGSSRHWVQDCPDVRCAGCGKEAPGHLERECGTRPMKRHISAPPEEPVRCVGVVIDNVFLEGIINEAKERKEKERQMKAVPIPPPRSANPEPPASPITGPSRPRPDTPIVFRKVDPDWTPDTTQWTWDSSWLNQKHLSGEEWKNMGRNARKEWFDEEEDDGVDWELYGDGEHEAGGGASASPYSEGTQVMTLSVMGGRRTAREQRRWLWLFAGWTSGGYWRQFEGGGSWERQRGSAGMQIEMPKDELVGTISDVDVDKVLGVEGMHKALTRSHDGGEEGEELVRAQHADAAPRAGK
ncbi:predicted protein [Postia placenta Mad-698-R]|nr:predicted protein [Postia placenta Mad-698-R]